MSWRPEGWDNPYPDPARNIACYDEVFHGIYEAGADAILKGLREKGLKVNNINPENMGKGIVVFIPDDEEKE